MTQRPTSRQAILDAAMRLLPTHGAQGTSVADIIAESGTSAGAIYHHFANKNAIIVEVAHSLLSWPLKALEAYQDDPASPATLLNYAIGAHRLYPELGPLITALGTAATVDDELGHKLRHEFGMVRTAVDDTIENWARRNDIPIDQVSGYSQLLMGLAAGFVTQRALIGDFDGEAYRVQAMKLLEIPQLTATQQTH